MSKFQIKTDSELKDLSNTSLKHPRKKNLKKNLTKVAVVALTSAFLLGNVNAAQAADTTPMDSNPGYAADFSWKGFNWEKRFWDGAPHFNKDFDRANVSNPDANGHITMQITNPTGSAPVAAEFQSTRKGFGYGTYSTTIEKNTAALQKEVVWGCLFTYDPEAAPGYTEIDLCEASAWGGGAAYGESWPVEQGHGYWFDATKPPGQGNNTTNFIAPSDPILTHKMVWEPGKITFETFSGEGFNGTLLKRTVLQGSTVPVPAKEQVHFNLWVAGGGGGDAAHVKPEKVVIRDFNFTPAGTTAAPAPTASSTTAPAPTTTSTTTSTPTATTAPKTTKTSPSVKKSSTTMTTQSGAVVGSAIASAPIVNTNVGTSVKPNVTAPAKVAPTASKGMTTLKSVTVATPIKLSHTVVKTSKGYNAKLKWTGAKGAFVRITVNGATKTYLNSGSYTAPLKSGATNSIKVCDATKCSTTLEVTN